MSAQARLEEIITVDGGVARDLYHAMEVLYLDEFIGREASRLNAATFGQFFGSLQPVLGRFLVLQVARLFEFESPRYRINTIPAAIAVLRDHSDQLVVRERPNLIRRIARPGVPAENLEPLLDPDLTRFVADHFDQQISGPNSEGRDNAEALRKLRTVRDKWVVHPEAIRLEDLPRSTFADIDRLLELAKRFVAAVGIGYLGASYDNDEGRFFLSGEAKRSTICLRRLLKEAKVVVETPP